MNWTQDERVRGLSVAVLCIIGGICLPWMLVFIVIRLATWLDRLSL